MRNDGAGNIKGSMGGVFVAGWYCYLLLLAAVMTYLLITMGGIVCVTGGSSGCPDWPGCYGQPVPPMRIDSLIEYSHRLIAALTSPFIIAAAVLGLWRYRSIRWVSWPPALAIVLLIAVVIFGALVVLRGLPPGLAAVDLGSALMVLALMLTATVVAFARHADPTLPDRLSFHGSFARLTLWTLVVVFIVLVSGVLVARSGSLVRCLGWPLFSGRLVPADAHDWLKTARLFIAGLATILLIAVIVQAWRLRPRHGTIRRTAMAVGILFLVELLVGMLMLARGYSVPLLVIYVAAAAALWALLVVLAVLAGLPPATLPEERNTTV
jgi:cytochrome c oxidase assembly protein subunit 15